VTANTVGAQKRRNKPVLPDLAATVVKHGLLMIRALWLAVRGGRDVPADGKAIHYSGQLRPMMWVFFVLGPLEIALVELAVPWPPLRLVLVVFGVLSALWFLALIATLYKYPHSVDPRRLRLRYCSFFDLRVPVTDIETVSISRQGRSMRRSAEVVDGVLILEVSRATNVSVTLHREHQVDLGLRGRKTAHQVDFWADDPARAVQLIRARIT
jgi:hypothetical protein